MKEEWHSELRDLRGMQADLRRRLEVLDEQIASLSARLDQPAPEEKPALSPPALPKTETKPAFIRPQPEPDPVAPPPKLPAPQPQTAPVSTAPPIERENLEMRVGRYWLVRIGIVVLLTGLVLLGNLAYQAVIEKLGAAGKLGFLYLAGGLLAAAGFWLEKKVETLRNYARVLLAGGAATVYYTTYAAHFVRPLCVIESPLLAGSLLLLLAGGFTWFALRRKAESVAFTAILLSYYTSAINPAGSFTLFSNVLLAGAALFLLGRHRWAAVSWLSLAGSYLSFAYWRWHAAALGELSPAGLWTTHGFLAAYWLIFTAAVFLRRGGTFSIGPRLAFLTANNTAFFALAGPTVAGQYPGQFWVFSLLFGFVLIALSLLARKIKPEDATFDGTFFAQGLVAVTIGLTAKFSGYQLSVLLAAQSLAVMFCGRFRHQTLNRIAASLLALGAFALAVEPFFSSSIHQWVSTCLVALLLLGNARLAHPSRKAGLTWSWLAAGFSLLGAILLGIVLSDCFAGQTRIWALVAAAAIFTLTLRLHGLPEFTLAVQGFYAAGWLFTLSAGVSEPFSWPLVFPALLGALALMHWWQRNRHYESQLSSVVEGLMALAFCGMLGVRLFPYAAQSYGTPLLAGLGLVILAYAALVRAWPLAALGQAFVIWSAWLCGETLLSGNRAPYPTLAGVALIAIQPFVAGRLLPLAAARFAAIAAIIYRSVCLLLGALWIFQMVPAPMRFFAFALSGGLLLAAAFRRKLLETFAYSIVLQILGVSCFWFGIVQGAPLTATDWLAILVLAAWRQMGRQILPKDTDIPQVALPMAAFGGLWLQLSRWAWETQIVAPTVVWAALAFALLGAGFLLRERAWRLMGLLVLAVAVGHVFFVDVWKIGQFAGILGIIGLAIILLFLGFIYNRFATEIKKWL